MMFLSPNWLRKYFRLHFMDAGHFCTTSVMMTGLDDGRGGEPGHVLPVCAPLPRTRAPTVKDREAHLFGISNLSLNSSNEMPLTLSMLSLSIHSSFSSAVAQWKGW